MDKNILMSDLAHHKTVEVNLIFLGLSKSDRKKKLYG